jgi:hypothetical protein
MSERILRPKARAGLLSSDHSKRGNRLIAIVDPSRMRVTLLEPWEHAILVLCDGTRTLDDLAGLMGSGVAGEIITQRTLERCLKYFEQEELIDPLGLRAQKQNGAPPGPRTLAHLQQAYREWHRDPVKTGQILTGMPIDPPVISGAPSIGPGLSPTVALPKEQPLKIGDTLTVGDEERPGLVSVLDKRKGEPRTEIGSLAGIAPEESEDDRINVRELLAAVDDDMASLEVPIPAPPKKPAPPPVGKASGGIAEIPAAKDTRAFSQKVVLPDAPVLVGLTAAKEARAGQRPVTMNPEVALNPTMVGVPPPEAPTMSGPRGVSGRSAGERVGAVVAAEPKSREDRALRIAEIDAGLEATQQLELVPGSARATVTERPAPLPVGESTTSQTMNHLSIAAKDVFERLRAAGLKARSYGDEDLDNSNQGHERKRRRNPIGAQEFQAALELLTAGDLDVALQHFEKLGAQMPESKRVNAFLDAIRAVRSETEHTAEIALDHFEGLLEDALAYGRCPRCLSMMAADSQNCTACGFGR